MLNEIIVQTELVDSKTTNAMEQARALTINTIMDLAKADGFCVGLKNLEKEIIDTFADAKAKTFAAHRAVTAAESKHLAPVQEARKIVKGKMSVFRDEQERIRQADELRQQEAARIKAEDEALAAAEAAETAGYKDEAEAIINAPVEVAPIVIPREMPKMTTIIRKIWTYRAKPLSELTNQELLSARTYLVWDESKLSKQARATQDSIKIPGVEFYQKPI